MMDAAQLTVQILSTLPNSKLHVTVRGEPQFRYIEYRLTWQTSPQTVLYALTHIFELAKFNNEVLMLGLEVMKVDIEQSNNIQQIKTN